jgi:anaerobic magnesium-protoporphyrin IX monomethyl ester cyclase
MLNIGFIMSSSKENYEPFRNQPLVIMYLLTILEQKLGNKINLNLIDLRGVQEESALFHIPECDVFLYSAATPDFLEIEALVKDLRSLYPGAKHIGGGPHINLFPEVCAKVFDTIALGEGEETIVTIIEDIFAGNLKPLYKQGKSVDLDAFPYPDRKYSPRKAVVDTGLLAEPFLTLPGTTVLFSRGCPFNCHFCANKDLNFGPVRFRSARLITEEIEYLKREYGVQALALKDDNSIPVNVRIARPFLEAIGRTGVKWRGQSRANGVHPDMVKLARDAGCTHIGIGMESASQQALEIINKHIDLDKARDYIRLLRDTGIGVRLHFILGLPGEPDDIVKRTLAFIDEAQPTSVLLNILTPMPGSEIFNHPENYGIKIKTYDWKKYFSLAGRFEEEEGPDMIFEYDKVMPWGKGMSREQIVHNYVELQTILRERGLNF